MPVSHAAAGLSNTAAEGERNRVGLLEMLTQLADPRSSQGKRHKLVFVLACAVVATLAGATNYRQLASQVADLPQSLLAELGARWNWFRRRFGWPSEPTLRRVRTGACWSPLTPRTRNEKQPSTSRANAVSTTS